MFSNIIHVLKEEYYPSINIWMLLGNQYPNCQQIFELYSDTDILLYPDTNDGYWCIWVLSVILWIRMCSSGYRIEIGLVAECTLLLLFLGAVRVMIDTFPSNGTYHQCGYSVFIRTSRVHLRTGELFIALFSTRRLLLGSHIRWNRACCFIWSVIWWKQSDRGSRWRSELEPNSANGESHHKLRRLLL